VGTSDGTVLGMTQVVNHGDPALRWNLVMLGDGYQSAQINQFHSDVTTFLATMYQTPPYDELWCGINVYRIDVTSTDSGADDPTACGGTGATARTYFDASFCNGGIRRLLEVNTATVHSVVNAQMPQAHMIMVIVNSTVYGGSGGDVATFSLAAGASEIGLHEMGHTAFGFADEYEYWAGCGVDPPGTHDRYTGGEPGQPNITADDSRATNKWRDLVAAATPMPTTSNANCAVCDPQPNPLSAATVGTYEGAGYFHCGLFRPQFTCRMRALGNPYCAVCQRVIRQTIGPHMPSWTWGTNTIGPGQTQRWWLWWPSYPGLEVIGVQAVSPGDELRYESPGVQRNSDGSGTYFVTVVNPTSATVTFHFRGTRL
jgi:IgA Peptidase M64